MLNQFTNVNKSRRIRLSWLERLVGCFLGIISFSS